MADINLKLPLRKSSKGAFASNTNTVDAIKDDLKMLILTNHGERVIHGDYGANLRKVIFDNIGPMLLQSVQDSIVVAVEKWLPFVILNSVIVTDSTTDSTLRENEVHVEIAFSVGSGINGVLKQRIRV